MWLDWLTRKSQGYSCLCLPSIGIIILGHHASFYVCSGDLNLGPHVCMANTLIHVSRPSLFLLSFFCVGACVYVCVHICMFSCVPVWNPGVCHWVSSSVVPPYFVFVCVCAFECACMLASVCLEARDGLRVSSSVVFHLFSFFETGSFTEPRADCFS